MGLISGTRFHYIFLWKFFWYNTLPIEQLSISDFNCLSTWWRHKLGCSSLAFVYIYISQLLLFFSVRQLFWTVSASGKVYHILHQLFESAEKKHLLRNSFFWNAKNMLWLHFKLPHSHRWVMSDTWFFFHFDQKEIQFSWEHW